LSIFHWISHGKVHKIGRPHQLNGSTWFLETPTFVLRSRQPSCGGWTEGKVNFHLTPTAKYPNTSQTITEIHRELESCACIYGLCRETPPSTATPWKCRRTRRPHRTRYLSRNVTYSVARKYFCQSLRRRSRLCWSLCPISFQSRRNLEQL
jgi:hypothetical protein